MPVALIAEFKVPTGDFDRFIAAAGRELEAVRRDEPGCLRFDVIVFDAAEGRGAFVEVFADEEAAEKHRELDHVKAFFADVEDIDVEWTARPGHAIG